MQALGFQFPWTTIFRFCAQRLWETITNNFLVPWKFMGTLFFYGEVRSKETADQTRPEEQVSRGSGEEGETRLSETAWTWFWLFITLRVGKKLLSHLIAYWAPLNNHQKESGNTCGRNNNLLSCYVLDVMVQHRFSANKINRKAREKKATVVWEWIKLMINKENVLILKQICSQQILEGKVERSVFVSAYQGLEG